MKSNQIEYEYFTKEFVKLFQNWNSDEEELVINGTCIYDSGNEEYIALVVESKDSEMYEDYDYWTNKIAKIVLEIIAFNFEDGDHAVVLECTTHGNDSVICLITACK